MPKITAGPKLRNPNDATFRNVTALKVRVTTLEHRTKILEKQVAYLIGERIFGPKTRKG